MNPPARSPLGQPVTYATRRDAGLLFPIARAESRAAIGLSPVLPFAGADVWNAYELSWLDARGKPAVAIATLTVPADSPALIESKSLKLYLNGLGGETFADIATLTATIAADLSAAAGAAVAVALTPRAGFAALRLEELAGDCIDDLAVAIDHYGPPQAAFLEATGDAGEETLVSHLLKSNCPVTGQPDWASVQIRYRGPRLDRAGLLRYLVSYREHAGFHEQCVERIFIDLMRRCAPEVLSVYARYTRRGGLDINPWRATPGFAARPGNPRGARQ